MLTQHPALEIRSADWEGEGDGRLLGFGVQETEEIGFNFQTLDNRFND